MALTKGFDETKHGRAIKDPAFRDALLTEAVTQFLANDLPTGKMLLGDYIQAAFGFERLAQEHGIAAERLRQLLVVEFDTDAGDLLGILASVQKASGLHLTAAIER